MGGYEGTEGSGQGAALRSSLTTVLTLHLGLQLIHPSEQVHEEGQGTRPLQPQRQQPLHSLLISLRIPGPASDLETTVPELIR